MFKKIVVILVIFTLLNISVISVGAENNNANEDYNVLTGLKIVNGYDEENYMPFSNITKGEFLNFVCNMMGESEYSNIYDQNAVDFAKNIGLIQGDNFDSFAILTYQEAITILVRALGFETFAVAKGGFPYGYLAVGKNIGLLKDVNSTLGKSQKKYEALKLLYNALDAPIAIMDSFSEKKLDFQVNREETIISYYKKIYKVSGIVTQNQVSSLRGETNLRYDEISIGSTVYKYDKDNDLLGYNVTAYAQYNENDTNIGKILYITPNKNNQITIVDEDIFKMSDNYKKLEYYKDDKMKTANISATISVIYNGKCYPQYKAEDFLVKDGNLELVDNNNDNIYDVIFINSFETLLVDYVSKINNTVINKYSYDGALKLLVLDKDFDYVEIIKNKEQISIEDLKEWDVLRVKISKSTGKKVIAVQISDLTIEGKIQEVDNTKHTVLINKKTYKLSNSFLNEKNITETTNLGIPYVFHLDSQNKVVCIRKTKVDILNYGILTNVCIDSGIEKNIKFKIFTKNDKHEIYNLAPKLSYNGEPNKNACDIYTIIIAGKEKVEPQVIGFKLNNSGEISSLEIATLSTQDNKERLSKTGEMSEIYRYNNDSFESKIFLGNNPIIWIMMEDKLDKDEGYGIVDKTYLISDGSYNFVAYNVDDYKYTDMIVLKEKEEDIKAFAKRGDLFMVDSVGSTILSNGDKATKISGYMGVYSNISVVSSDDDMFLGIKHGDVISIHTNSLGEADALEKYYSLDFENLKVSPDSVHQSSVVFNGTVIDNDFSNGRMKIDCTKEQVIRTSSTIPVLIYDKKYANFKNGAISDISPNDYVIVKMSWSAVKQIVVIK